MAAKKETEFKLTYKGKPMTRRGNKIYYGDFSQLYYVEFTVLETEKRGDLDIAKNVSVELKYTSNFSKDKSIKKAERENLYSALDIGEYWLSEALEEI